jgi:hypothetical protein
MCRTRVLVDTFWPKIEHTNDYLGLVVSIFGTTLTDFRARPGLACCGPEMQFEHL